MKDRMRQKKGDGRRQTLIKIGEEIEKIKVD